jgi:hypothetical protein
MNRLKLFLSLALSAAFASLAPAAEEAKPAAPAKKPESFILWDFSTTPNSFAYGTWSKSVSAGKGGITILKGADGKGGCGADCDLNLDDARFIELGLAVGVANEVPQVQLVFEDGDGTTVSWRVGVSQIMPTQPVWFRLPIAGMKIDKPGKDGKLETGKIIKWHLQGDFSTEKPMHFMAIALRARR